MYEFLVIASIGFVVSIISGVFGLGGAVILIPAYLYVPQLFGLPPIDIKTISGLTSIQVFATSLVGMTIHKKKGNVHTELLYFIGIPMAVMAFAGAFFSQYVDGKVILFTFAIMALTGALMMILSKKNFDESASEIKISKTAALTIAVLVGTFGGMVGAPGAFLLVPLLITILKVPTRVTIGSSLGIVLFTSLTASLGKVAAGQVDVTLTTYAIAGSIIGVIIGSNLSYKFKPKALRFSLAVLISGIAVQMLIKMF